MASPCALALATVAFSTLAASALAAPPNIVMIVGDDVGYADLGLRNCGKAPTPTLDGLIGEGLTLSSYYAFKICSPSRASSMTGRYPWASGFYDMTLDLMHTTANFTIRISCARRAMRRTRWASTIWARRSWQTRPRTVGSIHSSDIISPSMGTIFHGA